MNKIANIKEVEGVTVELQKMEGVKKKHMH